MNRGINSLYDLGTSGDLELTANIDLFLEQFLHPGDPENTGDVKITVVHDYLYNLM